MKLAKDLLYNKDNENLDIARFCALIVNMGYLGLSIYSYGYLKAPFEPMSFGSGWATVAAGSAAWIFARQKWEVENTKAKNPAPTMEAPPPYVDRFSFQHPYRDPLATRGSGQNWQEGDTGM